MPSISETSTHSTVEATIAEAVRELKHGVVPTIYEAFDAFLSALDENPADEALLECECAVLANDASKPLYDTQIKPSAMRRAGDGWQMQGFHAVPGLPNDLASLRSVKLDARITGFYANMDAFAHKAHSAVIPPLITLTSHATQWTVLGKVWRYRTEFAGDKKSTFVPPHFDRSVFSVMLDSRLDFSGESRHLCIGAPDPTVDIDAIAASWNIEDCHMPCRNEYPVVLAGIHAHKPLGLAPRPHSVLRMDPTQARYRYSLLLFVVPRKGLDTPHAHLPSR